MPEQSSSPHLIERVHRFFRDLGPGLVTGAADDDPSGISTYSVTGAAFGYGQLWTVLFSFPLMTSIQIMCARLGLVTGKGLAGNIRARYPRPVLYFACSLLLVANIVNIGADLGGMGDAMEMVTGVPRYIWIPGFAIGIVSLLIFTSYHWMAKVFKWMTVVLVAYILAGLLSKPDWGNVIRSTFLPNIQWTSAYLTTFLGIMGTTITPYMFFWQAGQEVEEERRKGLLSPKKRFSAIDDQLRGAKNDVLTGMGWAGIIMYFIILTTGTTLHQHGIVEIETAKQAAEALKPFAGNAAYLLFTLGLVGTGLLGVPILAGSGAYAVSEAMHWRGSLEDKPRVAGKFYTVIALSVLIGFLLEFIGVNSVKALFWSAVLNGVLAPPLLVMVVMLSGDQKVMGDKTAPKFVRLLGWIAAVVMGVAAIAMVGFWL